MINGIVGRLSCQFGRFLPDGSVFGRGPPFVSSCTRDKQTAAELDQGDQISF